LNIKILKLRGEHSCPPFMPKQVQHCLDYVLYIVGINGT